MNNGRIWCVVNPTVGLPLFLGGVAVIALTVHFAVLNNTTWFKDYWAGSQRGKKASVENRITPVAVQIPNGDQTYVINVTPVTGESGTSSFAISVSVKPTGQEDHAASAAGTVAQTGPTLAAADIPTPQ